MEIKTGNDIHVEIGDNAPDRSVMTELEFHRSIKEDVIRGQKKWVSVDDLIKWINEFDDGTAFNEYQIRKTTLIKLLQNERN